MEADLEIPQNIENTYKHLWFFIVFRWSRGCPGRVPRGPGGFPGGS